MAVCIAYCAAWCLLLLVLFSRGITMCDFSQEWTSARNYLVGRPVYAGFLESYQFHTGVASNSPIRYNAHPPCSVLVALPFGHFEQQQAYYLWNALSVVCLVASLGMIFRLGQVDFSGLAKVVFVTLVLTSNALCHHVMQGQLNLLLLVLLSGAWVADRKGWTCLSGVLIGLAAALKIYPAALILYPLALRKWRGVLAAACSFLAAILLALAVLGSDAFLDYFSTVLPEVSRFRDNWGNASILGFWSKLFDGNYGHVVPVWYAPQLARGLTLVCNLAIVGATLRTAARAKSLRDRDLAFALCMVAMLLVSPVTWDHYFVLAVVPLAILWKACASQRLAAGLVAAIAVLLLTVNAKWLWWATMPANLRPGVQPAGPMYVLTVLSCQFYVLVAFYLLGWSRLGAAKRG